MYLNVHIEVDEALNPQQFAQPEQTVLTVEQIVALILQTKFGYVRTEVVEYGTYGTSSEKDTDTLY